MIIIKGLSFHRNSTGKVIGLWRERFLQRFSCKDSSIEEENLYNKPVLIEYALIISWKFADSIEAHCSNRGAGWNIAAPLSGCT